MPVPKPRSGEEQDKFMNRCVSFLVGEGRDQKQAVAICFDTWRRSKGITREKNGKLQTLRMLNAEIPLENADKTIIELSYEELKDGHNGLIKLPRSTLIKANGIYNGAWHPDIEFTKSYKTFDRQPANNNHSELIEDEIGWWEQVQYQNQRLTAIPVINLNTANGKTTLGYVKNRMLAGKPAELSVGFWCTESRETFEHDGKQYKDQLVVREIEGDHAAYVTRGACSPNDGAGIGLSQFATISNNPELEEWLDKKPNKKKLLLVEQNNLLYKNLKMGGKND